jgi:SAM-dependent methyltransferase
LTAPERSKLAREARRLAKAFSRAADQHPGDEAGFLDKAEAALEDAVQRLGSPPLDKRREMILVTGRADTVFNRLVVEWEAPGQMSGSRKHRANRHAIGQVRRYIDGLIEKDRREPDRLAGVACDGRFIIFARYRAGRWIVDDPVAVDDRSAEQLLTSILAARTGRALTAENLLKDFSKNLLSKQLSRALLDQLNAELGHSPDGLTAQLYSQWERFFAVATGVTGEAGSLKADAKKALATAFGHRASDIDPARALFALQTYFAIVTKLIATLALSLFVERAQWNLAELAVGGDAELLDDMVWLHRGSPFREIGLSNVIEPDVFGWFLVEWPAAVRDNVRLVVSLLKEYDPATLQVSPEDARDLLKDLYQGLLPRPLRHALGQYFTPDWLADRTLERLEYRGDPEERLLDPACGTGTFLVLAIGKLREQLRNEGVSDAVALRTVLGHVTGFDIDPLAIVAARANYVLALGPLVGAAKKKAVDLPVYLADSIVSPTRRELLFGDRLVLETAAGRFDLPACVDTEKKLREVCDLVPPALEEDWPVADYVKRAGRACGAKAPEREILEQFFRRCREQHTAEVDGIWPRVIRNAFMPAFLEKFDVVAGNPPWVNWEHLPASYRERTKPIWEKAGLFVHIGMAAMLGAGKKDVAMLMSYTVTERLLRDGGKLGFVITETVFKTSGAGQGFRRFKFGDSGPSVKALHVDEMIDLNPFEGASNRTALMTWERGKRTRYPVGFTVWQRTQARGISRNATSAEVEEQTRALPLVASPVNAEDPTSPWITAPRSLVPALRKLVAVGESAYHAHEGVNSGGANGIYWVMVDGPPDSDGRVPVTNLHDVGKKKIPKKYGRIERDLLHPLIRGTDVQRWQAQTWNHLLFVQDSHTREGIDGGKMQSDYPGALAFLAQFEKQLRSRAAYKRYHSRGAESKRGDAAFWSMFDVGSYTLAAYKVIWKDIASDFAAAVVPAGKPIPLPAHTVILLACNSDDEAHYVCGLLNSIPARTLIAAYVATHISTHTTKVVHVPKFDSDDETHRKIVMASQAAHAAVSTGECPDQEAVDLAAARLWDLAPAEVDGMREFLTKLNKRDLVEP